MSQLENLLIQQIDRREATEFLQELIRARSDYPPGDCRAAIQVVSSKLSQEKIAHRLVSRRSQQPNLLASLPSDSERPGLLFHSHIDTVSEGDRSRWPVDAFGGEMVGGRVHGRGAGDDKGSVAAQVMALAALRRLGVALSRPIHLAIVSDEESGGQQGTGWLHRLGHLPAQALVVGEQTENCVAIAERVACGIDLIVRGKSAHGAMPWIGENAVLRAARVLVSLQDKLFPVLQGRTHPYLPPPTLNVGKVLGGIQWNIVPEWCKIEMDRRLLPGETRECAMDEIRSVLDDLARTEPLSYDLQSSGEVAANVNTPSDHPFVVMASQVLSDICGGPRHLTGYVQTSDGRWFARDGIPIIIFGPGNPALAHTADEFVEVEQLIEAARFYALLAWRWSCQAADPTRALV